MLASPSETGKPQAVVIGNLPASCKTFIDAVKLVRPKKIDVFTEFMESSQSHGRVHWQ